MIPAAFDAAFAALDRRLDRSSPAPLAVALSGGSDSLALLRIAKAWAEVVQRPLSALTVDHGLHPDSAGWTVAAGEAAHRLGVASRALVWTGPKPSSGLPAAARLARHALLAEAARGEGARVLLVGHTADDAAESELIRAETPTHGRLTEWSPSPAWPQGRGVFILRPLLGVRRAELRAWLAAEGVCWLDDPANTDVGFARSRARLSLDQAGGRPVPPAPCPTPPSCLGASRGSGVLRRAGLDPRDEDDGGDGAKALEAHGVLEVDVVRLMAAERPTDALAKLLLCASGRSRPPAGDARGRLLARLADGGAFTATLSGARVTVRDGRARLTRELGRSPPPPRPLAPPGAADVFDGRFELLARTPGWRVGALAGHAAALPRRERDALAAAPAETRPSLPVLLGPGAEVRLPAPFGGGPAESRCLVAGRLASALGLFECERMLTTTSERRHGRSVAPALILS